MRPALALLVPLLLVAAAPTFAAEGPEPPHAPTPDEAAAAYAAPARPAATPVAKGDAAPAAKADAATPAKPATQQASGDGEAVRKAQENGSYKMKDGGMYQPPQSRPAPLWNKGYGRT